MIHSPNVHSGQDWARLNLGAGNWSWFFQMDGKDSNTLVTTCFLLGCLLAGSWNQDWGHDSSPGIPTWDKGVPNDVLMSALNTHPTYWASMLWGIVDLNPVWLFFRCNFSSNLLLPLIFHHPLLLGSSWSGNFWKWVQPVGITPQPHCCLPCSVWQMLLL